jgi:hypothetical protein
MMISRAVRGKPCSPQQVTPRLWVMLLPGLRIGYLSVVNVLYYYEGAAAVTNQGYSSILVLILV